jgi:hypothetical protein
LTACLEKTILSEKMIEEDLSGVGESATKCTYRLGVGFERCEDKGEKSAPKFITSSTYHKEEATIKPTKAHHPSNPKASPNPKKPSNQREEERKNPPPPPVRERKLLFACFVVVLVTWMSFASDVKELRGSILSMLETHIVMSSLISRLVLILMFHLALLHVLFLSSLVDLTITHMVLVHEKTVLTEHPR